MQALISLLVLTLPFGISLKVLILLVVGLYELIVRVFPTIGTYSLLAKVVDLLKWLSDYFDRKKK